MVLRMGLPAPIDRLDAWSVALKTPESDEARYSNSMTTSISTGIRPGNDPMPTADRA